MSASSTPTVSPFACNAKRQIGRDGRFADPALARGDRDDRAARPAPARFCACGAPAFGAAAGRAPCGAARGAAAPAPVLAPVSAVSTAVTESTPGKASTACSAALRSGSRRGAALGLDLDREADIAVAHDDARYHAERDDVARPCRGRAPPRSASRICCSVTAIAAPAAIARRSPSVWPWARRRVSARTGSCRHLERRHADLPATP